MCSTVATCPLPRPQAPSLLNHVLLCRLAQPEKLFVDRLRKQMTNQHKFSCEEVTKQLRDVGILENAVCRALDRTCLESLAFRLVRLQMPAVGPWWSATTAQAEFALAIALRSLALSLHPRFNSKGFIDQESKSKNSAVIQQLVTSPKLRAEHMDKRTFPKRPEWVSHTHSPSSSQTNTSASTHARHCHHSCCDH